MRTSKKITLIAALIFLILRITQCSITQNLESIAPVIIKDAYYQSWSAGVKGVGSGIHVFIKLEDTLIKLDSIYFRNKVVAFEVNPQNKMIYIGRFIGSVNQQSDMVMHLDPKKNSLVMPCPKFLNLYHLNYKNTNVLLAIWRVIKGSVSKLTTFAGNALHHFQVRPQASNKSCCKTLVNNVFLAI